MVLPAFLDQYSEYVILHIIHLGIWGAYIIKRTVFNLEHSQIMKTYTKLLKNRALVSTKKNAILERLPAYLPYAYMGGQ